MSHVCISGVVNEKETVPLLGNSWGDEVYVGITHFIKVNFISY